jgi:glyoxylate/hydroxypyruvate reductase A
MALLIDLKQPDWMTDEALRDQLLEQVSDVDIRIATEPGRREEIEMLVVSNYFPGEALKYPNLKLIQKTGAGVNNILADDELPREILVARLQTSTSGNEMAEYALAYVLQEQRHIRSYHAQQSRSKWISYAPRRSSETTVAILGLGRIGQLAAQRFIDNQFKVIGWSRSQKELPGVDCYVGEGGLRTLLGIADYVVSILPSTGETLGLFNRKLFEQFKAGAFFINVGRGDLVNEKELMQALDDDLLAGAILDVVSIEPLPEENPLWLHPGVQLTPHISGYHLGDAIADIAGNFRRLETGQALLHLVDRKRGY